MQVLANVYYRIKIKLCVDNSTAIPPILDGINSKNGTGNPCNSTLLGAVCQSGGGPGIGGGCASLDDSCTVPEVPNNCAAAKGKTTGSFVSAYGTIKASDLIDTDESADAPIDTSTTSNSSLTTPLTAMSTSGRRLQTGSRPKRPKQARFVGCCVGAKPLRGEYGGRTCKRMKVGRKAAIGAGGKALVMNPLKQMTGCNCFNIRVRLGRWLLGLDGRIYLDVLGAVGSV
jgi:hypothetical protein